MLSKRNLMWRMLEGQDMPTCVLEGVVGEDAGLEDLVPEINGPVRFDMFGITRINSTGVREWLRFVSTIDGRGPHRLARCAVPVVSQLNMIDNFKGSAIVESVQAPFFCESCEHEESDQVSIQDGKPVITSKKCPECGEDMTFDELESRYFYFLGH